MPISKAEIVPNTNWQTKILARTVRWDWHNNLQIHILDENEQPYLVLDEWQTFVFHEADGNHTIHRVIAYYPSNYKDKSAVPKIYKEALFKAAKELIIEHNIIQLWHQADSVHELFDLPKTEYDEMKYYGRFIIFKDFYDLFLDRVKRIFSK